MIPANTPSSRSISAWRPTTELSRNCIAGSGVSDARRRVKSYIAHCCIDALLMLLRSAATNDAAAERMPIIFRGQLAPVVRTVVGDPAEATQRAGLIATQMLGLALCRHILRLPPVAALSRDAIVANIGPTIQQYLSGRLAKNTPR